MELGGSVLHMADVRYGNVLFGRLLSYGVLHAQHFGLHALCFRDIRHCVGPRHLLCCLPNLLCRHVLYCLWLVKRVRPMPPWNLLLSIWGLCLLNLPGRHIQLWDAVINLLAVHWRELHLCLWGVCLCHLSVGLLLYWRIRLQSLYPRDLLPQSQPSRQCYTCALYLAAQKSCIWHLLCEIRPLGGSGLFYWVAQH